MAQEIILMTKIDGLGLEGDIVKVADGYARNFLYPKEMAEPVTPGARRRIEQKRQQRLIEEGKAEDAARKQADLIEATSCTIKVKTGEEGKLFGSVTSADIVEAMDQQGIKLDKQQIKLGEPVRELGVFTVSVKLHTSVTTELKVWVVEE